MIKKLRIKFILVSTCIISFVLCLIIGFINVHNFTNVSNDADRVLNILEDNNGEFPREKPKNDLEMPFENRYFVVKMIDENIVECRIDRIASVNEEEAKQFAIDIKDNKLKGYYNNFRYRIKINGSEKMIIFLDCNKQLNTFYDFLKNSIIISLIGLSIVIILIIVFSYFVFKPVEETYKKQKIFITDASHELKTPLTTINACCDILKYSLEDNEWVNTIDQQCNRLTELTNKLVFLSKVDEGNNHLVLSEFSLDEVANEVIQIYVKLAKEKKLEFNYFIDKNVTCKGDVLLVKELLTMLLDNALKYCQSQIDFKIEKNHIMLSNDVESIPQGNLDILFERFYQLDKSRNSDGHGIGLSVCKAICNLHKWKISAKGNKNKIIFEIIF